MKRTRLVPLLAALLLITGCSAAKEPEVVSAPPLPTAVTRPAPQLPEVASEAKITPETFNGFAVRVFQNLPGNENRVAAPLSMALSLETLMPGAAPETAQLMADALGMEAAPDADTVWASLVSQRTELKSLAPDSLWQGWGMMMGEGPSLRVDYSDMLALAMEMKTELVDYDQDSTPTYTAWVNTATGGLITRLSEVPTENMPLTLASAAVLDGRWSTAFNADNIRSAAFTLESGQRVSVPMMTAEEAPLVLKDPECTFVGMTLDGGLEAWMILPAEGQSMNDFVASLTAEKLQGWRDRSQAESCYVTIPQVDITTTGDLAPALRSSGLEALFSRDSVDFSGIGSHVYLGSAMTAARVRLTENGVGTAGAALSQRQLRGLDQDKPTYSLDRPYFLAVAERRTGALLLLAAVMTPFSGT